MSGKRAATSELDHNNWDAEEEPEEHGVFRTASKEELQRRVIRTGRRRAPAGDSAQGKKSIFSGFSGFNKPAPSSFDFLSNLTNGAGTSTANGSTPKESSSPSGLFGIPPVATSTTLGISPNNDGPKAGLFGSTKQTTTNEPSSASSIFNSTTVSSEATLSENKPTFSFGTSPSSIATSKSTNIGIPSTATPPTYNKPLSMFTSTSKNASPVSTTPTSGFMFGIPPKTSESASKESENKMEIKFGSPPTNGAKSEPTFGIPSNSSTTIPGLQLPSASVPSMFNAGSSVKSTASNMPSVKRTKSYEDSKETSSSSDKKTQYYSKLKGLNESVSEWIKKHVNENPLCILTPIFKDYEKYLKELEDESNNKVSDEVKPAPEPKEDHTKTNTNAPSSLFTSSAKTANENAENPTGLSLASAAVTKPFSFGSTTSPFGAVTSSVPAPFSFGIGSTFNSNSQTQAGQSEEKKDGDEDYEPPKVDFTPVAEENSVFDKRCKIFIKKDGNFVDIGVGTLYIKTIENSSKHQLLVRANTVLRTVLLNFILSDSIPTQRMGKNNVMVVCIPTPEAKPPPVPILVRVKTSEEADSLLETLEKFKN